MALATGLSAPSQETQLPVPSGGLTAPPSSAPLASASAPSANPQQGADPLAPVMARIYQGESGGNPNALYGGGNFGFPNWAGRMGPAGISHAAGLAQDQPGTWHDAVVGWMAANPGQPAPNFNNPKDQDKVNRFLAVKTYYEKTGRDLISDARAGKVDYSALAGLWPSLAAAGHAAPDSTQANRVREAKYAEAADLDKAAQAAIKQIGDVGGDISKAMERVRAAQDKAEQAQAATLAAIGKPPKQPELDAVQHLGSLATVVGILGGLFTRAPMRASINGMAAALEAYNAGDQRAYQQAYGNWKTQTDMLFKIAQLNANNVKDILYAEDMGINERRALLDSTLRAAGLSQLADAARTQGEGIILDWEEKMQAAQQAYQTHIDTLENTQAWRQAQLDAKSTGKWEVVSGTDPKGNPIQYRYNPDTAQATDLTGQPLPFTPTGAAKVGASASGMTQFTDADKKFWARVIAEGGSFPPGLSRTAAGSQFVQSVMKDIPEEVGSAGGLIASKAGVQADQASLRNMTKMADAATSFERTAILNFDKALQLAPDAVPSSLGPYFNRWIMDGETMFGDPTVPPYVTAMLTGANEYAKIMSGSTGSTGSTVDSRREAAQLFSPYLSLPQIKAVVAVAKYDMDNRKQALYGQIDDIKGRLQTSGGTGPTTGESLSAAAPGALPVPVQHQADPDGTKYRGSDGKVYVKEGGHMLPVQ
jgi:hypothetical protein